MRVLFCLIASLIISPSLIQAKVFRSKSAALKACKKMQLLGEVVVSQGEFIQPVSKPRLLNELRLKAKALGAKDVYLRRKDLDAAGLDRLIGVAFRCQDEEGEVKPEKAKAKL